MSQEQAVPRPPVTAAETWPEAAAGAAQRIDITSDTCPMTFVRTRLALDRLAAGAVLAVRLRGEEPRRNLPRTAAEQGHAVLGMEEGADGTALLLIRKGG